MIQSTFELSRKSVSEHISGDSPNMDKETYLNKNLGEQ
jgi:hypothetical protein